MDLFHLKCQQNDKYYEKENLLICFNKLDIFFYIFQSYASEVKKRKLIIFFKV